MIDKKMITRKTAIGITLIVLIGLTSWGLAGALEEQSYINQGKAEYNRGNYDAAIYLFNKAIDLNPDYEYLYNDRGMCYMALGELDTAISEFSKAIELKSDCVEAYYNRGLAHFKQGGWGNEGPFDLAIADYGKVTELKPDYADAYYNRGLAYNQLYHYASKPFSAEINETYHKAIADFDKVLELDPTYVLAYAGKGNAYYRNGEFDNATAEFDNALDSWALILEQSDGKGLAGVYASRARNYKEMLEINKSISDYEQAIALDPKLMIALSHQASNYDMIGEYEEAIETYDAELDILENDPDYKDYEWGYYTYKGRGACCYELGRYDEAIVDFQTLIDDYESHYEPLAYRYLGMIYTEKGDEDKAKENYDKAVGLYSGQIESTPDSYGLYNDRGLCYLGLGEYDSAISDFEKVIELEPNYVDPHSGENLYIEAYKNLGIAYSASGDKDKAKEALEEGLKLANEQGLKETATEIENLLGDL
ncbi:Tetratricopeptide (TPR) repeat containing protein [Methanophagales archaeon]|nr:Tetratricopeptide (TPR) repeat containing protein [Methanophagales archaeon]